MDALYDEGRRAWPDIVVAPAAFTRWLADRATNGGPVALQIADLYIACACAAGDERALAAFERRYLSEVEGFLASVKPTPGLVDDVRQQLRDQLFVAGKIGQYSGRGSLRAWLRVVTLRLTSNLRRQERRHEALHEAIPDARIDPELAIIRKRHGRDFEEALGRAMASLEADDRTLLRLHYLDGLNIDRIAIVFGVSRATVGRRLIAVRERILEEAHRQLSERLGASRADLASLLRAIRSDLAMSLSVVLRDG